MKAIKYTDSHKYPTPYQKSTNTDIAARFRRVRAEQAKTAELAAANAAEAEAKVRKVGRK